jgi:ribosomal-protein-alanine N-acetyltransferase
MKINFFDLKEFFPSAASPVLLSSIPYSLAASELLTEYAINEMFELHMQVSQTVWDRKMFYEELRREGSGFLICYLPSGVLPASAGSDGFQAAGSRANAVRKFTVSDIDPGLKLDLQSSIIGFFIFYTVLDEMHVLDITVAKEMQLKGIGSLMLDRIINTNAGKGIKHFFLEVRVSNSAAINLYKKFGFKVFLLRKKYYDDNGEDALCMVKEL